MMKPARLGVVALLVLISVSALASPGDDENHAKHEDIRRLMEVSGELRMMRQAMLGLIENMRQVPMDLPEGYWEEFKYAIMTDELPLLLVPVYDRHFSHDEILALIDFWESPLGQMLARKQPLLQADAMGVSERWGTRISVEIVDKLRSAEGQDTSGPDE